MQVKLIVPKERSWYSLEEELNEFLRGLEDEPIDIKVDMEHCAAMVEYVPANQNELCCDCKFWDDNGDNLIGLCQRCGGRKRFSDKSCKHFEDVRGR